MVQSNNQELRLSIVLGWREVLSNCYVVILAEKNCFARWSLTARSFCLNLILDNSTYSIPQKYTFVKFLSTRVTKLIYKVSKTIDSALKLKVLNLMVTSLVIFGD